MLVEKILTYDSTSKETSWIKEEINYLVNENLLPKILMDNVSFLNKVNEVLNSDKFILIGDYGFKDDIQEVLTVKDFWANLNRAVKLASAKNNDSNSSKQDLQKIISILLSAKVLDKEVLLTRFQAEVARYKQQLNIKHQSQFSELISRNYEVLNRLQELKSLNGEMSGVNKNEAFNLLEEIAKHQSAADAQIKTLHNTIEQILNHENGFSPNFLILDINDQRVFGMPELISALYKIKNTSLESVPEQMI